MGRNEGLQRAAARASNRSMFLAHVFAEAEGLGYLREDLMQMLECDGAAFDRASLCFAPAASSSTLIANVEAIAEYSQVSADGLLNVLNLVESSRAFSSSSDSALLAARDKEEDE